MRAIVPRDADAFFAAFEQASDAKLRGIIAAASDEARRYGVYTPMPTMNARKLCPKLIVQAGDYERYEQSSN